MLLLGAGVAQFFYTPKPQVLPHARLVMKGGSLSNNGTAIKNGGNIEVETDGTKIDGNGTVIDNTPSKP
jgi:hypothetical protein